MLLNPHLLNPRRGPPNLRQRHIRRHLAIHPDTIQRLAHDRLLAICQPPDRLILPGPKGVPVRQDPGAVRGREGLAVAREERLGIRISPAVVVAVDDLQAAVRVDVGRGGGRFLFEVVGRDFGEGGLQVRHHVGAWVPGRRVEAGVAPEGIVWVVVEPVGVERAASAQVGSWEPCAVIHHRGVAS